MSFQDCVSICLADREFVQQFDRLNGTHLSTLTTRAPIEAMIDEATGRDTAALHKFFSFVFEFVWLRFLPPTTHQNP